MEIEFESSGEISGSRTEFRESPKIFSPQLKKAASAAGQGRLSRVLQNLKRVSQKEDMVSTQSRGAVLGAKHLPPYLLPLPPILQPIHLGNRQPQFSQKSLSSFLSVVTSHLSLGRTFIPSRGITQSKASNRPISSSTSLARTSQSISSMLSVPPAECRRFRTF